MKKLISFLIIILLIPNMVNACPHIDKNGKSHFQFYNDTYTEMTMMYPRLHHLYGKIVPLLEDGSITDENQDKIISESYGFPLLQDKQTYWYNYWFTDKDLMNGNWKDQDIQTTIEGIDNLNIQGENYNIDVGLTNTFSKSKKFVNDEVTEMYYNVFIKKLNKQKKGKTKYENIIKDYEMKLIISDIIEIKAEYAITSQNKDLQYSYNKLDIDRFHDTMKYNIKSKFNEKEIVAVNLLNDYNEDNLIKCNYLNDHYTFEVDEPGVYILIEKQNEIKKIIKEETREKNNNIVFIFVPVIIILSLITIFILKRK